MRRERDCSRHVALVVALLMAAVLMAGCANPNKTAYNTLMVSQATYDVTFEILDDSYDAGAISDAQKNEAIRLGNIWVAAHNSAQQAYEAYFQAQTDDNEAKVEAALQAMSAALAELLKYKEEIL